jgi:hypothetical protein
VLAKHESNERWERYVLPRATEPTDRLEETSMLTISNGSGGGGGGKDPNDRKPLKWFGGHYVDLFATDVLLLILQYLSAEDLVQLRLTNSGLKRLVDRIFNEDPEYIERLCRARYGELERQISVNLGAREQRALVDHALTSAGRLDLILEHISRLPNSRVTYQLPRSPLMRLMPDTQQWQDARATAIRELQGRAGGLNFWAIVFIVLLVVFICVLYAVWRGR